MAITFVNAASKVTGTASATSVATAVLPAGVADGDMLVMSIAVVPPISITSVPANWNFLTAVSCGITFAGLHVELYSKTASSEPSTYSAILTGSDLHTTNVVAIRGTSAIETSTTNFSSSGNAIGIPSISPTKPNEMWLAYAFQYDSATTPSDWTLPAGFTNAAKVINTHAAMCVGYQVLSASGATGTVVISAEGAAAFNPWASVSMVIFESAGGGGGATIMRLGSLLGVGL